MSGIRSAQECSFEKVRGGAVIKTQKRNQDLLRALKRAAWGFCSALFNFIGDCGWKAWMSTFKILRKGLEYIPARRGC